ncbi:MAG: LysR substrate-binding domain-containing protein [Bacillota bacterium]
MYLSKLELLCEVARVKSISKTARLLHLNQSEVEDQVRYLEDFYGVRLFDRGRSGVVLTHAGRVVVRYAKEILKLHDTLEKEIETLPEAENQSLSIGASTVAGNYILPCFTWCFREKYPRIKMESQINNAATVLSILSNDMVSLALLEEDLVSGMEDLVTYPVSKDEILIIAPPREPWLRRKSITLEELKKTPFITREKGSGLRAVFEKIIYAKGLVPGDLNIVAEMDSLDEIKVAVAAGLGLSACCGKAAGREIRTGLVHPLLIEDKSFDTNYLLVYKAANKLDGAAKKFVRLAADHLFCNGNLP